ncbi:MAG TPA: hypothetical protein PLI90_02755, partial [Rhodocyclaceae bacterium]|nr:hypothetical protein [Rhodocyclaceae bacterium]
MQLLQGRWNIGSPPDTWHASSATNESRRNNGQQSGKVQASSYCCPAQIRADYTTNSKNATSPSIPKYAGIRGANPAPCRRLSRCSNIKATHSGASGINPDQADQSPTIQPGVHW